MGSLQYANAVISCERLYPTLVPVNHKTRIEILLKD